VVDFVEICNVCVKKAIIKTAKRIINSDKMCRSYSDLNFGVTFFGTQCRCRFLHLNQFLSVVNSVMCCHGRRLQRGEG